MTPCHAVPLLVTVCESAYFTALPECEQDPPGYSDPPQRDHSIFGRRRTSVLLSWFRLDPSAPPPTSRLPRRAAVSPPSSSSDCEALASVPKHKPQGRESSRSSLLRMQWQERRLRSSHCRSSDDGHTHSDDVGHAAERDRLTRALEDERGRDCNSRDRGAASVEFTRS